jgi:hypothetical protein
VQVCKGFPSPIPPVGAPIDFNFLPVFANTTLGVMPHTVQARLQFPIFICVMSFLFKVYTLQDPTGGTYGNLNFTDILNIALYAAQQTGRDVVFFPENSYWVCCSFCCFSSPCFFLMMSFFRSITTLTFR